MGTIAKLNDYQQRNQDQTDTQFAEDVLADNEALLIELATVAGGYAQDGDSSSLYIMVKAVNETFSLAQKHMKHTIVNRIGTQQ